jgi:RNA polymerase sigma factor (sigma-70 family)
MKNENDVFARLYSTYGKKVYMLAYGMSGDSKLAQDVVQDTFARVIAGFDGFRGDSSVGTWIYAIAKNECLRNMARIRRGSVDSLQDLIDTAASAEPPGLGALERKWYTTQVKEGCLLGLLRCLSFHQRMAFTLSILFDLPARDVSIILKKSANSVRILASRARAKIKDFLCANCSLYDPQNACRCGSPPRRTRPGARRTTPRTPRRRSSPSLKRSRTRSCCIKTFLTAGSNRPGLRTSSPGCARKIIQFWENKK